LLEDRQTPTDRHTDSQTPTDRHAHAHRQPHAHTDFFFSKRRIFHFTTKILKKKRQATVTKYDVTSLRKSAADQTDSKGCVAGSKAGE
jgi:hypothetical protein